MAQRLDNIEGNYNINKCYIHDKHKQLFIKNPHCIEYFCNYDKITDCTKCHNHLLKKKIKLYNEKEFIDKLDNVKSKSKKYCKKKCNDGYIYNYVSRDEEKSNKFEIDKYKTKHNFKHPEFIKKYNVLPYVINYENTFPKPKSVVHWGQLKMLLVTIIFFINVIDPKEEEVHVIYAGSATGDNILLLCQMFPNTKWYLVDPRKHNPNLYKKLEKKDQINEIIQGYFTDDIAIKYSKQFKDRKFKLLFMSDIREGTEDEKVLNNQDWNITWHKIIQPDFSYLKFRCGYETDKIYKYYKGNIYLQIYAPPSSTETRILLKKELEEMDYNIEEYQGKLLYFNRLIRPSYHKSIIKDNNYFDHCYDCTYFSYVIKNYISKFKNFNSFNTTNILSIMFKITNFLKKFSNDKIKIHNDFVRNNIL